MSNNRKKNHFLYNGKAYKLLGFFKFVNYCSNDDSKLTSFQQFVLN